MTRAANAGDVPQLAALFDAYRQFYGRAGDAGAARRYVGERLAGPTRFFVDREGEQLRGFVHLLPSFDTLAMRPMWILEDLFVISRCAAAAPGARSCGTRKRSRARTARRG